MLEFTPEFVDEIFKARDINNDGHITLNEWIVSFVDENNLLSEDRVKNAFRQLDKSGDRTVSQDELLDKLKQYVDVKDHNEMDDLVGKFDQDGDG